MNARLMTVSLRNEYDIVVARQRARQLARHLGFDNQDQARIATAVSELARNVVQYAQTGRVVFGLEGASPSQALSIIVQDSGPGIANLHAVLSGQYRSETGMGMGLVGARRLMDLFDVESAPGKGTRVSLQKLLPRAVQPLDGPAVGDVIGALAREELQNPLAEVQHQNQELLGALEELRRRQEELIQLNHELEDTNRGVVALYAELDEKAEHLRRADAMKTRFLSNMSHEFRTPLNSILAIAGLLERRTDGPLSPDQETQVGFVIRAAQDLTELVDDLLDIAKVEAGKIVVRPAEFSLARVFSSLRGMLRPLLVADDVRLVFEDPEHVPALYSDEGKLAQVLRNLLSNALKFTERGEVRVRAEVYGARVRIFVSDTGIGIAPGDQAHIFEEFGQVEHAMQRKVKGTGLGLALSRKLAELLGGTLRVTSALGQGAVFELDVPLSLAEVPSEVGDTDPGRCPVLVVDPDEERQRAYERMLRGSEFQALGVRSLRDAQAWVKSGKPRAVVLAAGAGQEQAWGLLAELKRRPRSEALPVIVAGADGDEARALALGADVYTQVPLTEAWLLATLRRLMVGGSRPVLIVDDDAAARYVLRALLVGLGHATREASGGEDGLRQALADLPGSVVLDLVMPGMSGREVLRRLRAVPETELVPVVVATSKVADAAERAEIERLSAILFAKSETTGSGAPKALADAMWRARLAVGAGSPCQRGSSPPPSPALSASGPRP